MKYDDAHSLSRKKHVLRNNGLYYNKVKEDIKELSKANM